MSYFCCLPNRHLFVTWRGIPQNGQLLGKSRKTVCVAWGQASYYSWQFGVMCLLMLCCSHHELNYASEKKMMHTHNVSKVNVCHALLSLQTHAWRASLVSFTAMGVRPHIFTKITLSFVIRNIIQLAQHNEKYI